MGTKSLNEFKKADWQEIAKEQGVEFKSKTTVRQLCELIAEKLGLAVSEDTDELKETIYNAVNMEKAVEEATQPETETSPEEPSEEEKTSDASPEEISEEDKEIEEEIAGLSQAQIDEMEKNHYIRQASQLGVIFGMEQSAKDIKALLDHHCKQNTHVKYEPFVIAEVLKSAKKAESGEAPVNNELELLRAQCTELGLAYGEAHTVEDLKQLVNAIKGSGGGVNINPNANTPTPAPTPPAPTSDPNAIGQQVAPVPAFLQAQAQSHAPAKVKHNPTVYAQDVSEVDEELLKGYRGAIMKTIKGHFRAMTKQEIIQALSSANYPFTWTINHNEENKMQIEIILASKGNTVRMPNEDTNSWITIGG